MHALTRVLAVRYGPMGIWSNTLVPGATDTGLTDPIFADPVVRSAVIAGVPLGRIAEPSDYVGLGLFLASDASAYVNGAELVADGGVLIA